MTTLLMATLQEKIDDINERIDIIMEYEQSPTPTYPVPDPLDFAPDNKPKELNIIITNQSDTNHVAFKAIRYRFPPPRVYIPANIPPSVIVDEIERQVREAPTVGLTEWLRKRFNLANKLRIVSAPTVGIEYRLWYSPKKKYVRRVIADIKKRRETVRKGKLALLVSKARSNPPIGLEIIDYVKQVMSLMEPVTTEKIDEFKGNLADGSELRSIQILILIIVQTFDSMNDPDVDPDVDHAVEAWKKSRHLIEQDVALSLYGSDGGGASKGD